MEIIFDNCGDHTGLDEHGTMPQEQYISNLPHQVMKDAVHIHCHSCGCIKNSEVSPTVCQFSDEGKSINVEAPRVTSDLVHFSISWPGNNSDEICQLQGSLPPPIAKKVLDAASEPELSAKVMGVVFMTKTPDDVFGGNDFTAIHPDGHQVKYTAIED